METQLIWILALMFGIALVGALSTRRPEAPAQIIQIVRDPEPAPSGAGILILLAAVVAAIMISAA